MPSGSVTLANSRLSLVDGKAFVDFSAPHTLTPYLNGKLTLTDSAGKKAIGYIKAAGTGETLGDELVSDTTFDSAGDWTPDAAWSVAGGVATCVPTVGRDLINSGGTALLAGVLYKTALEITARTAGSLWVRYPQIGLFHSSVAAHTEYICNVDTTGKKPQLQSLSSSFSGSITSFSVKQVLTPASTGVTITSTRGGTTYNWTSIESGFNYNDASGYTYTIRPMSGFIGRPRVPRLFQR